MPSSYQSLHEDDLRRDLVEVQFFQAPRGRERFGVEIEQIPIVWPEGGLPEPVPYQTPHPTRAGGATTLPIVDGYAARRGLFVQHPGQALEPQPEGVGRGHFSFEPGGQLEFSSAAHESPAAAFAEISQELDGLAEDLAARGVETVSLGCNPWHTPEEVGLQASAPRYEMMDAHFASLGEFGRRMMRLTATVHVNVDLGSPLRAARRWKAAQLLSPVALATFASSPFSEGRSSGFRSFRGHVWTLVDPSRCGFPEAFLENPDGAPVEQYLRFALDAQVMLVREPRRWRRPPAPITFAGWMAHGIEGLYPDLEDWRYHLSTLFPEVRPKGFLELRAADGQPRAFWSVPLTWWTALLCDDQVLARAIARLEPGAEDLRRRWRTAVRDGLADPDLAADARFCFGLAADALGRFPAGFVSVEMQRAFLAFGERFTLARRAPSDDLLETYLDHGFDRGAWRALREEWCVLAGTPCPQV